MATSPLLVPHPRFTAASLFALGGACVGAVLLYVALIMLGVVGGPENAAASPERSTELPGSDETNVIHFDDDKAKSAGVRLGTVELAPLLQALTRPGRLALNERRHAQISPLVEGIIRDIPVQLGQQVKTGDLLLVLDSKELGQAKLELAKARLSLAVAAAQHDWVTAVNKNTAELLDAMAKSVDLTEIDKRFAGRPIGEWRQQLVTAYSRRSRGKQLLDSVDKLANQGAASAAMLRTSQGEFETAEASFQALREEIQFQNQQQLRSASQKLREAQGQLSVAETHLLMAGYAKDEVAALDPIREGARIGDYPLRAPFDGTVLALPASLAERASPQAPVLQLGDLSRVIVQVDLTESDLPAVRQLVDGKLVFHGPGLDQPREAPVIYVGDLVDKTTRTIPLRALADNADRQLKPGMFVDATLRYGPANAVRQVPATALQHHAGQTFVFVPHGDDHFARVEVRIGRATAERVEIVDGLNAGDRVVVEGGFALKTEMLRATLSD